MVTALPDMKDQARALIIEQRDFRLANAITVEFPLASGKLFSCSERAQNGWSRLLALDSRGLLAFPHRAYTFDDRDHCDITNAGELDLIAGAISTAVLAERALAHGYIDAVMVAADAAGVDDSSATYLAM